MATFSLREFQAQVLGGTGLARTNRFEVLIVPPPQLASYGRYVSLFVEQANLPLITVGVKPFKIHNTPAHQRPMNIEYGGEGLLLNIHLDGQMIVRRFFDDWMHLIANKDNYTINYQDEYASTVIIRQLNEYDQVTYEAQLLEAFPRNYNPIQLDHSALSQTQRMSVLFAYRKWQVNDYNYFVQYVQRDVPLPVTNPQVPRVNNRP